MTPPSPPLCKQGGTILTSLNLPAQSMYPSMPTLYALCVAAGVKSVVFYCGKQPMRFLPT